VRRIRVELAYDGTAYHGWQVQPGLPTIQAAVETVLSEIEGSEVHVEASGRTDAGVHALAQVAAFHLANPIPVENLLRAMNRLLPRDVRVLSVAETHAEFHPRFDAVAKTYEYRILRADICLPFERHFVYHHPYPLDEARMVEAAPRLEGEHDFTSFAASDESDALGRSKVRTIFSSRLTREEDRLIYRVRGSGFLKHMVRNIVGVLLEVGKGNLAPENVLMERDPGPTAPARGLFLVSVEYPTETVRL
jgi:tRNA pseudouridine38-40 synthase